ncbi:MAG: hypothetical protein QY322_00990 [bacterium]|nr:MAG: hypothetical protein QY322_00990 [bacterium]
MPFYVKYLKDGVTVVEKLQKCDSRRTAAGMITSLRKISDGGSVSLTSDTERITRWLEALEKEKEITPQSSKER